MKERQEFVYIGVDPIILEGDKVVLGQRAQGAEVEIGKWHIPGALVKVGKP